MASSEIRVEVIGRLRSGLALADAMSRERIISAWLNDTHEISEGMHCITEGKPWAQLADDQKSIVNSLFNYARRDYANRKKDPRFGPEFNPPTMVPVSTESAQGPIGREPRFSDIIWIPVKPGPFRVESESGEGDESTTVYDEVEEDLPPFRRTIPIDPRIECPPEVVLTWTESWQRMNAARQGEPDPEIAGWADLTMEQKIMVLRRFDAMTEAHYD